MEVRSIYAPAAEGGLTMERLKQYEDTGMEPEKVVFLKNIVEDAFRDKPDFTNHLRDLLQAEQDGRLVILPCKIGDTIYKIIKKPIPEKGWLRYVRRFSLTYKNLEWVRYYFGKRVFLSREEAEAAISVMERKAGKK